VYGLPPASLMSAIEPAGQCVLLQEGLNEQFLNEDWFIYVCYPCFYFIARYPYRGISLRLLRCCGVDIATARKRAPSVYKNQHGKVVISTRYICYF